MLAIGIVPISVNLPSFATPVFRGHDDLAYVQSSSDGQIIDEFLDIGTLTAASRRIAPSRLNYDLEIGDEFRYGFVDKQMSGSLWTRSELIERIDKEFHEYSSWPFIQLSFLRLSNDMSWIDRIDDNAILAICNRLMIVKKFKFDENFAIRIEPKLQISVLDRAHSSFLAHRDLKVSSYFESKIIDHQMNKSYEQRSSRFLELLSITSGILDKKDVTAKEMRFLLGAYLVELTQKNRNKNLGAAYIEPRPKSREPHAAISHYTIVIEGGEQGEFNTQEAAISHACKMGHRPVHVARIRHAVERDNPDHFRVHKCRND